MIRWSGEGRMERRWEEEGVEGRNGWEGKKKKEKEKNKIKLKMTREKNKKQKTKKKKKKLKKLEKKRKKREKKKMMPRRKTKRNMFTSWNCIFNLIMDSQYQKTLILFFHFYYFSLLLFIFILFFILKIRSFLNFSLINELAIIFLWEKRKKIAKIINIFQRNPDTTVIRIFNN